MLLTVANASDKEMLKNSLQEILRRVRGFSEDFLTKPATVSHEERTEPGKKRKSLKPYRISTDKGGRQHSSQRGQRAHCSTMTL